jgi:nucleoid-associated protein EbfC
MLSRSVSKAGAGGEDDRPFRSDLISHNLSRQTRDGEAEQVSMDMNKMLQQVQQMQEQMAKAQEELANETVEASVGGGMVVVKANGSGEITHIRISPEAIDPDDPEGLADLVLAGVNEALRNAQELMQSKLGGAMGGLKGLGLPGL